MTPGEVDKMRQRFVLFDHRGLVSPASRELMALPLLSGTSRPDSDYRRAVLIDPYSIVAIYPLDERPLPPRRVYVDRIEAHDKT